MKNGIFLTILGGTFFNLLAIHKEIPHLNDVLNTCLTYFKSFHQDNI